MIVLIWYFFETCSEYAKKTAKQIAREFNQWNQKGCIKPLPIQVKASQMYA